jgi:hypothetical protein
MLRHQTAVGGCKFISCLPNRLVMFFQRICHFSNPFLKIIITLWMALAARHPPRYPTLMKQSANCNFYTIYGMTGICINESQSSAVHWSNLYIGH